MALEYRLNILGWYNFERLIQTLLKEIIGPGVASFGGTKDGGREATFNGEANYPSKETKWRGTWIFQVKYSEIDSRGKSIVSEFKKEIESRIIRKRKWPDNYILITNVKLTADQRDKLNEIITNTEFIGNFGTIDGKEVCEFLNIYPRIRKSFPQLIGLADIERIFNKDLYVRSEAFVSDWQSKISVFVALNQYIKALEIIRKHHFVVLDGPPETGKSFIGAAMALSYLCDEFQIICINEPREILRSYEYDNDQLFFADDAIGTISFDPSLGNYWSRELPVILKKLDEKHKLIWTARSYILEEALDRTKLKEHIDDFPGIHEVIVEVGDFHEIEKALILYNHVKNSNLAKQTRDIIKSQANFICNHENFTPERIRKLVQIVLPNLEEELSYENISEWREKINEFFKNPSERFNRAYESLGRSEKIMLLTLLDLGRNTEIKKLKKEYEYRVSHV